MINAKRAGAEPLERVFIVDNHDEAYYLWRDAGLTQRMLLHLDAHHDMWWIADDEPLTISSFLCPALKQGFFREVIWVVPDGTWESRRNRRAVLRHLKRLVKRYPDSWLGRLGEKQIPAAVLGKPLTVCSLDSLRRIAEPVVLDIDTDFLVIPRVVFGREYIHNPLPWCWPADLVARLARGDIRTDLVTVAHSVEGGYTPLQWKHLADEVALRLRQPDDCSPRRSGMAALREAALAASAGEWARAEQCCRRAAELLPESAAPRHRLAHLCLDLRRPEEARALYQQALTLDPSLRTPAAGAGASRLIEEGREMERVHRRILTLDPENPYAHLGLAVLARRKRRWKEAEDWLRKALALDANLLDACRVLGYVLSRQGRLAEAIEAYERSLKLALAGHRPLSSPISTRPQRGRLMDPEHWLIHYRLARLHQRQGNAERAIAGYRMSLAGGVDGVTLRYRLARLYLKQKQWNLFFAQAASAVARIPADTWRALRRRAVLVWRGLRL